MSYDIAKTVREASRVDRQRLASVFAAVFVGIGVLGVAVPLLLGQPNLTILGLYLSVPLVLSAPVYYAYRDAAVDETSAFAVTYKALDVLFFTTFSLSVYVLYVFQTRPYVYYALVALMALLLAFEVFNSRGDRRRTAITLAKLTLLYANVVFSVTLKYNYYIGRTDLPFHATYAAQILEAEQLTAGTGSYEAFPLWHVFVAVAHEISFSGLAVHRTMMLVNGIIYAVGLVTVFSFCRRAFADDVVALSATFFVAFNSSYIIYGMYSVARSVTSILFLYLLLSLLIREPARRAALLVVFTLAIVLYHPVSMPFIVVILSLLYVAQLLVSPRLKLVRPLDLPLIGGVTLVYWGYRAEYVLVDIVNTFTSSVDGERGGSPSGIFTSPVAEAFNYSHNSLLLLLAVLSLLFLLTRAVPGRDRLSYCLVGIALVPIVLPGPALLFDAIAGANIGRFSHYGFAFLSIAVGIGAIELWNRAGGKTVLLLLLAVSGMAGLTVSNDFVASDNPLVERPFYTHHIDESEEAAFEFADETPMNPHSADRPTCRFLRATHDAQCTILSVEDEPQPFADHSTFVFREGELQQRPLQFSDDQYVYEDAELWDELRTHDKFYDSGSVAMYDIERD